MTIIADDDYVDLEDDDDVDDDDVDDDDVDDNDVDDDDVDVVTRVSMLILYRSP